jgi:hypothetical protein
MTIQLATTHYECHYVECITNDTGKHLVILFDVNDIVLAILPFELVETIR